MQKNPDNPEVVYHYTTMDTMMKIAKDACIWATSINYLNDVSEGDYFQKLVRRRIPKFLTAHDVDDAAIFDEFLDASTERVEFRPFVASFSQDGDSLPLWRSYCPNGNGVAIGFRVDCLKRSFVKVNGEKESPSINPTFRFVPVEYLDTPTPASLDSEITEGISWVKDNLPKMSSDLNSGVLFKFLMQLLACSKKHFSFSTEREFRLLLDGTYGNSDWLEFRSTRSTLVPYVPLGIPLKDSRAPSTPPTSNASLYGSTTAILGSSSMKVGVPVERPDFIDRVVIGPSPNSDLSKSAVELFFRKLNMKVEVFSSEIPYRDW